MMNVKNPAGLLIIRFRRLTLAAIGLGESYRKQSPHVRLNSLERVSGSATLVIAIGIAIELVVLFFLESHWDGNWFFSLIADLLILVGLLVEYLVIHETVEASKADRIESDLEVATAMNRAAKAQADLVEHKTARRVAMTVENKVVLSDRLRQFSGTEFDTGMAGGPGEVMHFCWDIEEVLQKAGWQQLGWGASGLTYSRRLRPPAGMIMADNVEIQIEPASRPDRITAINALIDALKDIGIVAMETPYNFANENVQAIHILIGPKL